MVCLKEYEHGCCSLAICQSSWSAPISQDHPRKETVSVAFHCTETPVSWQAFSTCWQQSFYPKMHWEIQLNPCWEIQPKHPLVIDNQWKSQNKHMGVQQSATQSNKATKQQSNKGMEGGLWRAIFNLWRLFLKTEKATALPAKQETVQYQAEVRLSSFLNLC